MLAPCCNGDSHCDVLGRRRPCVCQGRRWKQILTSMDQVGDNGSSSSMKPRPPNIFEVSDATAPPGCCSPELAPPLPPLPAWRCSCCWGSCAADSGARPSAKGLLLSAAPAAAPGLPSSTSRGDPPAALAGRDVLPGQAYGGTGCSATSISCRGERPARHLTNMTSILAAKPVHAVC